MAVGPLAAALDSQLVCVVKHEVVILVAQGLFTLNVVLWVSRKSKPVTGQQKMYFPTLAV